MSKTKLIKVLGLIGAAITAAVAGLNGDYNTAIGVVAASLSSINLRG